MPQPRNNRPTALPTRSQLAQASGLLKHMAHPVRLALLCHLLHHGETNAGELVTLLQGRAGQSQISQFLKQMRLAGLVQSRKTGQMVFYRIAAPVVGAVMAALDDAFCQTSKRARRPSA